MKNIKKIAVEIMAYDDETSMPQDKGGLFHIYDQDGGNTVVIEFAKPRHAAIAMHLTRFVGKVAQVAPAIVSYLKTIDEDVQGFKFYVYMGIVPGVPEFPVYVITKSANKPYPPSALIRLVKPVKIVGVGKSKQMEHGIETKLPGQVEKKMNILY